MKNNRRLFCCFFFQAEDGIRDYKVTGVQTCALPIFGAKISQSKLRRLIPVFEEHAVDRDLLAEGSRNLRDYLQSRGYFEAEVQFKQQRSEERRVGKECRSRWSPYH